MTFGFLGKSNNTHNPINRPALAAGSSMAAWVANFDKRHPICPINLWRPFFNVFFKSNQVQAHGCSFDKSNNVYMLCTINNLFLKGNLDANGNIINVYVLTPPSSQQLMRIPIGQSFDPTFTWLYSTNVLPVVPGKPSLPRIIRTNVTTGVTQGLHTPIADTLIIVPNGALVTEPNPGSNELVLYVCSFGTGQIIQVTINTLTDPPTEVSASVFAELPGTYAPGGIAALLASLSGKDVQDIPFLEEDGTSLVDKGYEYLYNKYGNYIPPGPVSVVPYPQNGSPVNPSSMLIANRLSSQIVEVQITPNPGSVRIIATSANGLNLIPFAFPNSFSLSNFSYFLVSNSYDKSYGPSYGPTITKLNVNGKQVPFIPTCVLNYFTVGVRSVVTHNGYIYIASTGNGIVYKISINDINMLV